MMTYRAIAAGLMVGLLAVPAAWTADGPFEPTWESVERRNPAPDWFRDAKFGIYFHWGVYSVPAFGSEWYPRNMHFKNRPEYRYHVKTYGEPDEFGYHDFVPMFTAEHFDAEAWAALFEQAGAKFAGPVAEHHDGFAMWDSELTPWNAMDKGPKRDITGELAEALRKRGMKLVATFHHARNNQHQIERNGKLEWTGHYPRVEGWPMVSEDPELRMLYGNLPRAEFLELWKGKLCEVIDKYQPDLMWFDSWLDEIPDPVKLEYLAYYFNKAAQWGREVVVTVKQRDLPHSVAVEDFEKGRADRLTDYTWLTDDTISYGSWCYTQNLKIKPTWEVIQVLIDIVSKNGQLLLNISPKADGSIPEEQRNVLLEVGRWLDVCGEGIYGTRPFVTFGEGPTRLRKGGHFVRAGMKYGPEDLRFTRKGAAVYVFCLGAPEAEVAVNALGAKAAPGLAVKDVRLLGSGQRIAWKQDGDALRLAPPEAMPCDYACAYKVALEGLVAALADLSLERGNHVEAKLRVLNLSSAAWDGALALRIDGEPIAAQPMRLDAGAELTCALEGVIEKDGIHRLEIALDGRVVQSRVVITPVVDLETGWLFRPGDNDAWKEADCGEDGWESVQLPQTWEAHSNHQGDYGWFRKHLAISAGWAGRDLILPLGEIDDADETYFNGAMIGKGGGMPPLYRTAYREQRRYRVPADLVRPGEDNVLAVRVYDGGGDGGMRGGPLGPVEVQ